MHPHDTTAVFSYFEQLRCENPNLYNTAITQQRLHHSYQALGPAFFDSFHFEREHQNG
jgi:hypothetical protein